MEWTLGPRETWGRMAAFLRTMPQPYPTVRALLVVSAHREEPVVTVQTGARPPLFFDYHGFPPHTHELAWAAPGDPTLVARVRELLGAVGITSQEDAQRGFDHGVFIPLKVAFPDPALPTVQLSLDASLDPRKHLEFDRALAPLRDEGVLTVGSGRRLKLRMSWKLARFGRERALHLPRRGVGRSGLGVRVWRRPLAGSPCPVT